MLNNIVDNLEQCGQQNIVHGCFHQARTGCSFFAVYHIDESNATQIWGYVLLHFINHSQHFIIFNFSNVHVCLFLFQVGTCARISDLVSFLHLKQQHGIGISLI